MPLGETLDLEIEDREEPVRVTFNGFDMRKWEEQFDKTILGEPRSLSMLTWLGWHAAVRQGLLDGKLKDWAVFDEACVGLQVARNKPATETRPTKRSRGGGSSAS